MRLRNKCFCIVLCTAVLLVLGGLFPWMQYWVVLSAITLSCIGAALVAQGLLKQINSQLFGRLSQLEKKLAEMPTQLTKVMAAECHSMDVILRRFPDCTLPTTSWSMRFTNLHAILTCLDDTRPHRVVEFGSGLSTVMVASWLRERGEGRLVSIDHDSTWADVTRGALKRAGLEEWAEVIVVPLMPVVSHNRAVEWYDLSVLPAQLCNIDFVIVDGPPAGVAARSLNRLAVLEQLESALSAECTIVLDDALRSGEQEVVSLWMARWTDLAAVVRGETTGLAILSRECEVGGADRVKCPSPRVADCDETQLQGASKE